MHPELPRYGAGRQKKLESRKVLYDSAAIGESLMICTGEANTKLEPCFNTPRREWLPSNKEDRTATNRMEIMTVNWLFGHNPQQEVCCVATSRDTSLCELGVSWPQRRQTSMRTLKQQYALLLPCNFDV